ncbi:hypothetical protein DB42_AQ00450 [Neochlamydia sp. EPS4]|nr:hypothetical protein DB42_AQ00450 [Neochlamydia sp. EPS4]
MHKKPKKVKEEWIASYKLSDTLPCLLSGFLVFDKKCKSEIGGHSHLMRSHSNLLYFFKLIF